MTTQTIQQLGPAGTRGTDQDDRMLRLFEPAPRLTIDGSVIPIPSVWYHASESAKIRVVEPNYTESYAIPHQAPLDRPVFEPPHFAELDTATAPDESTIELASRLSSAFWQRLRRFVEWGPSWDGQGAARISSRTAARAVAVARASLATAHEPFVSPAADGSLLLEWKLTDSVSAELFIEDTTASAVLLVEDERGVSEVALPRLTEVGAALADLRRASD